jgi:hypothetical protein
MEQKKTATGANRGGGNSEKLDSSSDTLSRGLEQEFSYLESALALARRGMAVFPLKPRGKLPLTKHGCLDATADLVQVRAWWTARPSANIGLATGARSGVWVLDIDPDKGGEASLHALEQGMGSLPATIEVITGGGGRHLYFRLPDSDAIKNTAGKLGDGLDTRGDGGYVVAPPSIHPSGKAYAWSVDSAAEFADAPAWLLDLLIPKVAQLDDRRPDEHWQRIIRNGVDDGTRNATAASLAGKMLRLGLTATETYEFLLTWNERNRPPLTDARILRTVESIAARELRRRS